MADKEYIEREALLETLNGLYDHHLMMFNYAADGATQDCIEAVINAPTADVVEVRHGKWYKGDMPTYGGYKCSVCELNTVEYNKPYCPNCGAKMDGKGDNA